jgi:hypothetical protein
MVVLTEPLVRATKVAMAVEVHYSVQEVVVVQAQQALMLLQLYTDLVAAAQQTQ